MRRCVMVALILLVNGLWVSAAGAQETRDPFDPLLTPGGTAATTDEGTSDTTTTPPSAPGEETPVVETPLTNDNLPQTGTDPKSWLAIAYVLVATGATFYVLGSRRGVARSA